MTPSGAPLRVVALTGATGFIGRHLLADLSARGYRVRVLLRRPAELPPGAAGAVVGDIARPQNMSAALAGVDAVIHSAGLAHAMSGHPADDYRAINTEATVALARAAERAGVKRFVFLSSIRAQTGPVASRVLTEEDVPAPTDAYGRSKLEAEEGLAPLGLDWVALRPVLVYGPGAKGNMAALIAAARSPWPLPVGSFKGKRSLVAVENLAAAVDAVLRAPGPLRRPLIVADPNPLSLAEIVGALRQGLGRGAGVVSVPPPLIAAGMRLLGRGDLYERLAGGLVASPAALTLLGWSPRVATRAGLAALTAAESGSRPGPGAG